MEPKPPPASRPIRSFVLRGGRITAAQQRACAELWPRFGLSYESTTLNTEAIFGRRAPLAMEIGFGNGEHLAARAVAEPDHDFLGVEVHAPGVGHLLLAAAQLELRNLRVIRHDAVDVVRDQLSPGTLSEIQILFPDPWPKKRHHKRRLIQLPFVELLASRLIPGGLLHLATDWEPYAEHMLEVLQCCSGLRNTAGAGAYATQSPARVATRFEQRGSRLGHTVRELTFCRRS
jgi:tRNA (guanine-N7-)-methyltransferase